MKNNPVWTDVAIDLEGLGLRPNAAVIAIGACALDRESGKLHPTPFYQVIKLDSALRAGTVDGSTLMWWVQQESEAREAIFSQEAQASARDLASTLASFNDWWRSLNGDKICPWGNGATADITWLESAYQHSVGLQTPWAAHFWTIRDQRTLLDAAWEACFFEKPAMKGLKHNARDDAIHQAEVVASAFRALHKLRVHLPTDQPAVEDDDEL